MRAFTACLLALCLAQGAMAAKTQQVAYSPPPPQGAQDFIAPGMDFSFIIPGYTSVTFTQTQSAAVCAVLKAKAGAPATCPTIVWADNEGTPADVQDVKVFGQLVYTFTSVPQVGSAVWNATYAARDALVKDVTANAATLFASAFPGTAVNCRADLSSGPTAASNLTQISASWTGALWNEGSPVPGAGINTSIGGVAVTPLLGAMAQLLTVIIDGPWLDGYTDPNGEDLVKGVLGVDTGKYCPSNLIASTGTWAPACDKPQSRNFPEVYVTQAGPGGIAFTGPVENAIASGAFACPYCYTSGGKVQAWSYDGPNRGKYCTTSKDKSVAAAVQVDYMYWSQAYAYGATDSCIIVGVFTSTGRATFTGGYGAEITIPAGSQGSLCMYDNYPLFAGAVVNAPVLPVLATDYDAGAEVDYDCQVFAVDAFADKPCAPEVVTVGPAAALAALTNVQGQPWSSSLSSTYTGSLTCNTKSFFASSISSGAAVEASASCFVLAEDFLSVATVPSPSPPPPDSPPPSPPPPPPPSPPPSPPPPPSPFNCSLDGTYTISVKGGRSACHSGETEYLVYYGGNAKNCATEAVFVRREGSFKTLRSHWTIRTDSEFVTTIVTEGRQCPAVGALGAHKEAAKLSVGFTGEAKAWDLEPLDASCTVFNVVNTDRTSRKYLSSYETCAEAKVFVASGDKGTGRQQWTLTQVQKSQSPKTAN